MTSDLHRLGNNAIISVSMYLSDPLVKMFVSLTLRQLITIIIFFFVIYRWQDIFFWFKTRTAYIYLKQKDANCIPTTAY